MTQKNWAPKLLGFLKVLVKVVGDLCIVFGLILIGFGVYGLAGGTGITFIISEKVVTPQEGGQATLIVGIILLLVWAVIACIRRYLMSKRKSTV